MNIFKGIHSYSYTILNPRLTRGVVATPPRIFLPLHKNAKETDPGLLGNLFYIFCAHFDEKKIGGTT